jgi:hypothetical protein
MDEEKAMELDKMVFEWWRNTDGVSLLDIVRHFAGEMSVVDAECAYILKNCWTTSIRKKEKDK